MHRYYCHNFGLNYGNYERTWERYQVSGKCLSLENVVLLFIFILSNDPVRELVFH